ncbi:unnamed protein product [Closterium sp. NIES-65]|nr:unnamed protein product [Closterium sp. NIES-65]
MVNALTGGSTQDALRGSKLPRSEGRGFAAMARVVVAAGSAAAALMLLAPRVAQWARAARPAQGRLNPTRALHAAAGTAGRDGGKRGLATQSSDEEGRAGRQLESGEREQRSRERQGEGAAAATGGEVGDVERSGMEGGGGEGPVAAPGPMEMLARGVACIQANLGPWSVSDLTLGLTVMAKVALPCPSSAATPTCHCHPTLSWLHVTAKRPPPPPRGRVVAPAEAGVARLVELQRLRAHAEAVYSGDSASWSLQVTSPPPSCPTQLSRTKRVAHRDSHSLLSLFLRPRAQTCLPESAIVHAQWQPHNQRVRPAFVVCVDAQLGAVVVAVRGTSDTADMLVNAGTFPHDFLGGKVHSGFLHASTHLLHPTLAWPALVLQHDKCAELNCHPLLRVPPLWPCSEARDHIEHALRTWHGMPVRRLVFVGHSLGAAVAILAGMMLRHENNRLHAHPHAQGSAGHGEASRESMHAVTGANHSHAAPAKRGGRRGGRGRRSEGRQQERRWGDRESEELQEAAAEAVVGAGRGLDGVEVQCVGYGPPACMTLDLAQQCTSFVTCVLLQHDLVPRYVHLLPIRLYYMVSHTRLLVRVCLPSHALVRPTTASYGPLFATGRFSLASVELLRQAISTFDWDHAEAVLGWHDEDWQRVKAARDLLTRLKDLQSTAVGAAAAVQGTALLAAAAVQQSAAGVAASVQQSPLLGAAVGAAGAVQSQAMGAAAAVQGAAVAVTGAAVGLGGKAQELQHVVAERVPEIVADAIPQGVVELVGGARAKQQENGSKGQKGGANEGQLGKVMRGSDGQSRSGQGVDDVVEEDGAESGEGDGMKAGGGKRAEEAGEDWQADQEWVEAQPMESGADAIGSCSDSGEGGNSNDAGEAGMEAMVQRGECNDEGSGVERSKVAEAVDSNEDGSTAGREGKNEERAEKPESAHEKRQQEDFAPPLYPPGRLLMLCCDPPGCGHRPTTRKEVHPQRQFGVFPSHEEVAGGDMRWQVVEVQQEAVREIVVSPWCISDHMPGTMGEGLNWIMAHVGDGERGRVEGGRDNGERGVRKREE